METTFQQTKRYNSTFMAKQRPVTPEIGKRQRGTRLPRAGKNLDLIPAPPQTNNEFLFINQRYAIPLLTIANLLLTPYATLTNKEVAEQFDLNQTYAYVEPGCFDLESIEYDGESGTIESQYEEEESIQITSGITPTIEQLSEGIPITITLQGTTQPLSDFPPPEVKSQRSVIICENEMEEHAITAADVSINKTLTENIKAELSETHIYTVTISTEPSKEIFSNSELNLPGIGGPQEPTMEVFDNKQTGDATMAVANNNGLQFFNMHREGNEIQVQPATDYIDLWKLVPDEACRIWADVYLRKGPKGEIYLAVMDLDRKGNTCLLKADSIEEAKTNGFTVHSIDWIKPNLADFNTIDATEIDGKTHLVASINALIDLGATNGDYYGQPVAVIEDNGDSMEGKLYIPKNIVGQSASPIANYFTREGELSALRVIGTIGDTDTTSYISRYLINPETGVMTTTENILKIDSDTVSGGCSIDPQTKQNICIQQFGSTGRVLTTFRHVGKVVHTTAMGNGEVRFPFNDIVDTEPQPGIPKTDLFVTQVVLSSQGELVQDISAIYKLVDNNGNKINFTDPLIKIMPDGSMHILAVALNFNESNALITFKTDSTGKPIGNAEVVQATNKPFESLRTGDYNGETSGSVDGVNINAFSFYVGHESMIAFLPEPGYTIKSVPANKPTPVPSATVTPISTPEGDNNIYLPVTHK